MKQIKLTESQLNMVLNNAVTKVIKEGAFFNGSESIYERLRGNVDAETILSELEHWLPNDQLEEFASDFMRIYDMG